LRNKSISKLVKEFAHESDQRSFHIVYQVHTFQIFQGLWMHKFVKGVVDFKIFMDSRACK